MHYTNRNISLILFIAAFIVIAVIEYSTPLDVIQGLKENVQLQGIDLYSRIQAAIDNLQIKSKNFFKNDGINNKVIELHKRYLKDIAPDERIISVVNKKWWFCLGAFGWSGLCITDKYIHLRLIKKAFFSSFYPKPIRLKISLSQIESIEIGTTDGCWGNNYVGNEVIINGTCVGLLRLGGGITLDEDLWNMLNQIFSEVYGAKEE